MDICLSIWCILGIITNSFFCLTLEYSPALRNTFQNFVTLYIAYLTPVNFSLSCQSHCAKLGSTELEYGVAGALLSKYLPASRIVTRSDAAK